MEAHIELASLLAQTAGLLHDFGKANDFFQSKLASKKGVADPLRHEALSSLIFKAICSELLQTYQLHSESEVITYLANFGFSRLSVEDRLKTYLNTATQSKRPQKEKFNIGDFEILNAIQWIILSHHKLPVFSTRKDKALLDCLTVERKTSVSDILKTVSWTNGFENESAKKINELAKCFNFKKGLIHDSDKWSEALSESFEHIASRYSDFMKVASDGTLRLVLLMARSMMMIGDYYYSSQNADEEWVDKSKIYANTDQDGVLKQKLSEHLFHVGREAIQVGHYFPKFIHEMDVLTGLPALKHKGIDENSPFAWQDSAVSKIRDYQEHSSQLAQGPVLVINLASTGKGKTIGNAKLMQALSESGADLRYIIGLGQRSLTLQTSTEYTETIGMGENDTAMLVGSSSFLKFQEIEKALKDSSNNQLWIEQSKDTFGHESQDHFITIEHDFLVTNPSETEPEFLKVLFPDLKKKPSKHIKMRSLLYKPIVVCTLDHIIPATESVQGGHHILPFIRLMSSDLVIDEIDDFSEKDLIAISRLIHLAGMLGRKVLVSSATITPKMAEGLFNAFNTGCEIYNKTLLTPQPVHTVVVDEFNCHIYQSETIQQFSKKYAEFIRSRSLELSEAIVRRLAVIHEISEQDIASKNPKSQYFQAIQTQCIQLHDTNHVVDIERNKHVSFGLVRVATIDTCIHLTKFLMNAEFPTDYEVRVMCYHSRQVLLQRNIQEQYLDKTLKRKNQESNKTPAILHEETVNQHIDTIAEKNILFILVVTPIEEVGRDHDFDYAVVEPSSYRSIIQIAGRVMRHRTKKAVSANMAIMSINMNVLKSRDPAYISPGFEKSIKEDQDLNLKNKSLLNALEMTSAEMKQGFKIDSIGRIVEPSPLVPSERFIDLEHYAIAKKMTNYMLYGADKLQGWLIDSWYLTNIHQELVPFRESKDADVSLVAHVEENLVSFKESDMNQMLVSRDEIIQVNIVELSEVESKRLWLQRNYRENVELFKTHLKTHLQSDEDPSILFGEIRIPLKFLKSVNLYNENLGWYKPELEQ